MAQAKKLNNPERVDSLIGWAILVGAGGVLFFVLARNIFPYAGFFAELLRGMASGSPILRTLIAIGATIAGWVIGIGALVAVQSAEAWPVLLSGSPYEQRHDRWKQKMQVASVMAVIGYACDAWFCSRFWPVLTVSMQQFRWSRMWSQVDWGNAGTTIVTLFGVALYILLWRFVRKVM